MTGYLTVADYPERSWYTLKILNKEVRQVFTRQVLSWFKDKAQAETGKHTDSYSHHRCIP